MSNQFDELTVLAKSNPDRYFEIRGQVLTGFIDGCAANKPALMRLQSQLDELRAVSVNPKRTAELINEMLMASIAQLERNFSALEQMYKNKIDIESQNKNSVGDGLGT